MLRLVPAGAAIKKRKTQITTWGQGLMETEKRVEDIGKDNRENIMMSDKRDENVVVVVGDKKRSATEASAGIPPEPHFTDDYFLHSHRNDDFDLSAAGKGPKDESLVEESFCSNFVCCGVHLADLHALLQHYEDVHVKVQNADDDEGAGGAGAGGDNNHDEDDEGELDVVGDSRPPAYRTLGQQDRVKRTDSVLSAQSFGSTAAADALLGVAASHYNYNRSQEPSTGGYYNGGGYGNYPPPPGYYSSGPAHPHHQQQQQYQQQYQQMGRTEQPVSAFDTTILRTVSPAHAGGVYPPGYPYYSPYYAGSHPVIYSMPQQQMYPGQMIPSQPYSSLPALPYDPQTGRTGKRVKTGNALPNLKAVQAASNTLRDSLPAALSDQDPNQFKLIYSILSNTLTPSTNGTSRDDAGDEPIDRATAAKNQAAAILSMPRPPIDKTLERPYICPVPGCGKAYKNPNGLKYHALHGHDGTNELVERPYRCPYGDCGKRYKNPNGLKYHVNKNHADMLPKSAVMAKNANSASKDPADLKDVDSDGDSDAHDHPEDEEDHHHHIIEDHGDAASSHDEADPAEQR